MHDHRQRHRLIALGLFSITLLFYWPATTFPFVNYDDPAYVFDNPEVLPGLSWHSLKWSLTAIVSSNWHPVTLWSHLLDCSLFGQFAGGHHLTSILLHATNTVLLWVLIFRWTKQFWPSALVAALFAWHPLNVESVAWISERKNVLSTFFFSLTLWSYSRYVEQKSKKFYALALLFFLLGLAAKPMLVIVPFILLLLDVWPLQRLQLGSNLWSFSTLKQNRLLLLEKIPFLLLTVGDSIATCLVQNSGGAVSSFSLVPLAYRLANIPQAYVTYLQNTFWPTQLCAIHPFPDILNRSAAIIDFFILLALTILACFSFRRRPWIFVGWFWFIGTLVPVIGLVQVGSQSWADRYAYLPLVGIFIIVAKTLDELSQGKAAIQKLFSALAAAALLALLSATSDQLWSWRSSVALFTRAEVLNPNNALVQSLLARACTQEGNIPKAIEHHAAAVRLRPEVESYRYDLGRALIRVGRYSEAQTLLADSVVQIPNTAQLHNLLGIAFMLDKKTAEAKREFLRAIELQADYANARFNLGKVLMTTGESSNALVQFTAALHAAQAQDDPDLAGRIAAEIKTYQNAPAEQSSERREH